MLTRFPIPEDSKELYFKLSSSLQICSYEDCSPTLKLAGIYAIFKDDTCYYVGQSQNVASRLSQHLSGKYESADKVVVFPATENGFYDFYERSKEIRKSILEANEQAFMQLYKPLENLITPNSDFEIKDREKFDCLVDEDEFYDYRMITIYRSGGFYDITTGVGSCELDGKAYAGHNLWIAEMVCHFGFEKMNNEGFFNG